jgi:hypothetical protein
LENRHDHQPTSPLPLGKGGGKGPLKKEKQGDVSERRETAQGVWYLGTKVVEKSKLAQVRRPCASEGIYNFIYCSLTL